jgi:arylsulfatase
MTRPETLSKRKGALLFAILTCVGIAGICQAQEANTPPNILLIVADDLGYADLGSYGGDIDTPNLDELASQGVRFSRFHTAPMCAPTRAMLLSGNDNHIAGMGAQGRQTEEFGYEGHLTDRIVTIPQLLRTAGYNTYMAGKWHLGMQPENNPHRKGFDRSYVNLRGAGNHYNEQGIFKTTPISQYTENGQAAQWPKGSYSTDLYTSKLIQFIEADRKNNRPFFAFAAYTSPHWPLQVDESHWKKYQGRYDDGYEKLRSDRFKSLKKAGMIPEGSVLPPWHPRVRPWDSLSEAEQRKEARKMELYAGMVDNLDYNIGRLIDYLKDIGEFENTLIVFMSDNGAAAEDFYHHSHYGPYIRSKFNEDYDRMGKADSFISYGPQWAEAGSAPFAYFKGYTTQGGMTAPMIITGPGVKRRNEIHHGFLSLVDLAPTFYDLAGATYPRRFLGREIYPLKGESLLPYLRGKTGKIHENDYVFALEHYNYAMVRKGRWKITSIDRPFDKANFKLYDMSSDLAEIRDLKEAEPDVYEDLLREWDAYAREIRIQIPTPGRE